MGLSRNKVAVSEGAAGSPPFYGECGIVRKLKYRTKACCSILKDYQILQIFEKTKNKHTNGGVAQLGEHLPCKQGVMGSIPIISTKGT